MLSCSVDIMGSDRLSDPHVNQLKTSCKGKRTRRWKRSGATPYVCLLGLTKPRGLCASSLTSIAGLLKSNSAVEKATDRRRTTVAMKLADEQRKARADLAGQRIREASPT
jgi:hypothetical protein